MSAEPSSAFFSPPLLTAARTGAGLSIEDLAAKVKTPASVVASFEAGGLLPSLATAYAMAKACGVEVVGLYTGTPASERIAGMATVVRQRLACAPSVDVAKAGRLATLFGATA